MRKLITQSKLLFLTIIPFLFSCEKSENINASGIIYSKHHVPMPFLTFTVDYSRGGKNEIAGSFTLITNENGFYAYGSKSRSYLFYSNITHLEGMYINGKDSGSSSGGFSRARDVEIILH